jgi:hypothetical protein
VRRYILAIFIAVAAAVLAACGGPRAEQTAAEPQRQYQESPILEDKVKRGELPPVEERLPKEPMVVDTPEPGQYGGP